MSDLSRLWAGNKRVYRDNKGKFVLDSHLDEPVVAFTCRVEGDYCKSLCALASKELGIDCEWRPI